MTFSATHLIVYAVGDVVGHAGPVEVGEQVEVDDDLLGHFALRIVDANDPLHHEIVDKDLAHFSCPLRPGLPLRIAATSRRQVGRASSSRHRSESDQRASALKFVRVRSSAKDPIIPQIRDRPFASGTDSSRTRHDRDGRIYKPPAIMFRVTREIEFCYGHRLLNYEGKCRHLHGHNGRAVITLEGPELDRSGMLVDFAEIKRKVQHWIDENLDHNMLLCRDDPLLPVAARTGRARFSRWTAIRPPRISPG